MKRIDADISPIAFGAFKIGRNEGIKYPAGYDLPDDASVDRLLNGVLDLGINLIDSAPAYGLSEERIGRHIGHRRGEYLISTKVGETFVDGASHYDFSANGVRVSVERSLSRMRTDLLDIVFVHAHRDEHAILQESDVVAALHSLRDAGKIRWIGYSGYTSDAFQSTFAWADAVMVEYHMKDASLATVIDEAAALGIAVFVKKGLASGHLDPADAIRFVLGNPARTTMVIGGLNLEHMRRNVELAQTVRKEA